MQHLGCSGALDTLYLRRPSSGYSQFNVEEKIMDRIMWNEKMELNSAAHSANGVKAIGLNAVARFAKEMGRSLRHSLTRMAVERELSALDDRSLADIGVIRANIGCVANKAAGGRGFEAAFTEMLNDAIVVPFKLWLERSKTERNLSRLSDRELLDIGLTRWDIPAVVKSIGVEHITSTSEGEEGVDEKPTKVRHRLLPEVGVVRGDIDWLTSVVANRNHPSDARPSAA